MKRGNKGQFYLISAVVLAMLVVGIFTISNYSERESNLKLNNLKEEIQTESTYVMDYGLYEELNDADLYIILSDFTNDYVDYQKKETDLYFIFGNSNNLSVAGYQKTAKSVFISSGSSYSMITTGAGKFTGGINPESDILTLSIDDTPYEFKLNKGENFYFILSQKINRGEHIITG
jgi:hypothetical protein